MKKYILALDLGTTGNRAIVFDRRQNIVAQAYQEFPQIYPKPGWVEHDPEVIWKSVRTVLSAVLKKVRPGNIACIGITNQRETVLVWDRRTGRPLHNAIVWQCRRTADMCARLKQRGLEKEVHARTGLFLDPYFSATKLRWLLDHVPAARKKLAAGDLLAGTIDAWAVWKLTGGQSHITDVSNASRTLLFNLKTLKWDERLCRIFGVPPGILPRVVPSGGELGVSDPAITGKPIPVTGIIGDQQAASFAQGCFAPGVIKNTYGTGLFALENTGRVPRYSKNLLTTVAWAFHEASRVSYAVEGGVFIGGAAIGWLRDGLKIIKNSAESESMARAAGSNQGVYFVPALAGLGAPYWDPHARGAFFGITRGTRREHIARAALEAIAYQTRDILEVMQKDTKHPFKTLRVDGGASANDWLMQFQADILGIPVERLTVLETTALGAAGVAGLSIGFWKDIREFNRFRKIDRIFRPRMKVSERKALYGLWKEAVRRSLDWARP